MSPWPTRVELLELDIDLRLTNLWRELDDIALDEGWPEKLIKGIAVFMRAAYGIGYSDALTEDEPGTLCSEHGYEIPKPRTSNQPAR